jgi:hypothetical protein
LEEVRREFSGLPVYVGVEEGYVYVKRTAPMGRRQFRKYTEVCRRLGFRFDRRGERWVRLLEELRWVILKTTTMPRGTCSHITIIHMKARRHYLHPP